MGIPSRVRIETENKPYPSASSTSGAFLVGMPATQRDAYLKELVNRQVRGERLSEEEAWKFYKLQFPKMSGLEEEKVKLYIKSIKQQTDNAKVVRGKRKLRKLAAIKDACFAAGLTKRGEDDKLIPIFQRGGRMNVQSKALAQLFHALSGIIQKRKPKKESDDGVGAAPAKMPQNMGVASSIPMQTWDPMLTRFMQRDYNAHVDSAAIAAAHHGGMFVEDPALTAMGIGGMGMGGMGAISGLDTSRTPTLQLPGKFARASDPSAWASFASLSDFPPLLRRKYEPKEQIGSGAFATVYRAEIRADGKNCAVKRLEKRISNESRLHAEVEALRRVSHPNITQLLDVAENEDALFLVIEYAAGGELFDAIVSRGNYTERDAMLVTKNVLKGLSCLHSHNIIHRDLKPENLLLSSKDTLTDVKITDFGMASILERDVRMTFTKGGTLQYVAPEIISSETGHSFPVDMWSLGVVVVCLLTGRGPFICRTLADYVTAIRRIEESGGKCLFGPSWNGVSPEAQNFVQKLLQVFPERRPTAVQALQDPWFMAVPSKRRRSTPSVFGDPDCSDETKARGRPLSAKMERSHTDELRNFTFERKRLRIESGAQLAALETGQNSGPSLEDLKLSDLATPRESESSTISLHNFDPMSHDHSIAATELNSDLKELKIKNIPTHRPRPSGGHRRQRSSLMHFINAGMNTDLSQLVDILSTPQDDNQSSNLDFGQFLDDFSRTPPANSIPPDSMSSLSNTFQARDSISSLSRITSAALPFGLSNSSSGGSGTTGFAGTMPYLTSSSGSGSGSGSGNMNSSFAGNFSFPLNVSATPSMSTSFPGQFNIGIDSNSTLRAQRDSTNSFVSLGSFGAPSPPVLKMTPKLKMLSTLHRLTCTNPSQCNYNRIKLALLEVASEADYLELKPAIQEYLRLIRVNAGSSVDQQLVVTIFERLIYLLRARTNHPTVLETLAAEFKHALVHKCAPFIHSVFSAIPMNISSARARIEPSVPASAASPTFASDVSAATRMMLEES